MLHYTIESPGGCCGRLGADVESGTCDAPTLSFLKSTPAAAKQVGQESWCETRGGQYMCLPRTLCIAGWFKALQRAVNAYAEQNPGAPTIRVDARIGPETLAAVQQIATLNGVEPPATTNQLTLEYYKWTSEIAGWAGVPINAAVEPKPHPGEMQQLVDDETAKKTGLPSGKGWWSWGKWVVLAALGTGIAGLSYSLYRKRGETRGKTRGKTRGRFPVRSGRSI